MPVKRFRAMTVDIGELLCFIAPKTAGWI